MGCSASKLDDLPAVSLCRYRISYLNDAIRHRYDFSNSHLSYLQSLKSVGFCLQRFYNHGLSELNPPPPPPPINKDIPCSSTPHSDSEHSQNPPLVDFSNDEESEDEEDEEPEEEEEDYYDMSMSGHQYIQHMSYMKSQPAPSVSYYQDKPKTGHLDSQARNISFELPLHRANSWDFMDTFQGSYTAFQYRPVYSFSSGRNSKEVREEEGIPDLEEEEDDEEYHKQISANSGVPNLSEPTDNPEEEDKKKGVSTKYLKDANNNVSTINEKEQLPHRDISKVVEEIKIQFLRASDSGNEISGMLEVGKLPYRRRVTCQVSSKMLHAMSPCSAAFSHEVEVNGLGDDGLELDESMRMRSMNLSSTLHKCYLWEKKLFNEVKAEERLRVIHERNCRKLKHLDERGVEASKLKSTRASIGNLSTKIRIAIQVVDSISVKINTLRDEELWPQINELFHGLNRMWKSMWECHHSQCQIMKDANSFGDIASDDRLTNDHLEATLELENELINWTVRFSNWIISQIAYVRALNNWLLKCLLHVPEETIDGVAPFSPGRIGAPPLFVVCNQWSQALKAISPNEVIESLRILAVNVLLLWERHKLEMIQRTLSNKDLEATVVNLEREDKKMRKEIQVLDKLALISGDANVLSISDQIVYQSDSNNKTTLHANLQRIFEAMERLAFDSARAYDGILQRNKEYMQVLSP